MATTEELTARAEALRKAMASGHKRVTYGDRTVEYRDLKEMREALAAIDAELAPAQGRSVVRGFLFTSEKGL